MDLAQEKSGQHGQPHHGRERSDPLPPALHATLVTAIISKPQHPTLYQSQGAAAGADFAPLKSHWSQRVCFCPADATPLPPNSALPLSFLLMPSWVEVLQHLLGLGLLSFCLFTSGEGHEHLQLWTGTKSRELPHLLSTAPAKASPSPPGLPQ